MPTTEHDPRSDPATTGPVRAARGTGAQLVYEKLRREILDLNLEPGALLDETELSNRYNVSRSPVREALIRLAAEGLVHTLRNRSSVVASFDIAELLGYFDALDLMYRTTARMAALNADEAAIALIRQEMEAHEAAIRGQDPLAVMARNADFHLAIAKAGGNPYFVNWTKNVLLSGQRILRLYMRHFKDEPTDDMRGEHADLLAAIANGDAAAAEAAAAQDARILSKEMLAFLTRRRTEGLLPASTTEEG
jgi:DNA-binding GntR family transcriptional regulator